MDALQKDRLGTASPFGVEFRPICPYSPKMIYDAVKMTAEVRFKGDKMAPDLLLRCWSQRRTRRSPAHL